MTEIVVNPAPGVNLSESYYAAGKNVAYVAEGAAYRQGQNRWDSAYNVEWQAGYPQKIAGWSAVSQTALTGIPRDVAVWRDHLGQARIGVGTSTHLYYISGATVNDISPLRVIKTGTLTNAIATNINSTAVVITDAGAQLSVGDWVYLSAASAVGGVALLGWYYVSAVSAGVNYTITVGTAATGTAGPAGGTISYSYPRINLTNPFTTTNGSATVTVTHTAHGANVGDYVIFSGGSSVAGLTIVGEFAVASVVDADNYTITAASTANANASGGGTVSVIYLVPLQQTSVSASVGYGTGAYGAGAYSASGASTTVVLTNGWTLSAYGNQLLACPVGGTIYVYNPVYGGRAYPLLNAPTSINAMFVTPERFVVAVGLNNAMQIAWADQTDYTVWTTTATNTALTSRTLVGGSVLVGGISVRPGQSLLFSDRTVFTMTYTATSQFIYQTQAAGDNCGLVAPNAVCAESGNAYWMSDQDFFVWNGSVNALQTDDIRAAVFGSGMINRQQLAKCTAVLNRAKRQVRFYYPNGSATENNVGMIFQFDQQNCWAPLNFGRTAGTDALLLATPVSADTSGLVYFDETGVDANGAALPYYLQLAFMDISNGDRNVDVMGFTPDFLYLSGNPQLTILTQYYPSQAITTDGPYVMDTATTRQDLRSDGKLFSFALYDNELGSNFRLGLPRIDAQPAGARR